MVSLILSRIVLRCVGHGAFVVWFLVYMPGQFEHLGSNLSLARFSARAREAAKGRVPASGRGSQGSAVRGDATRPGRACYRFLQKFSRGLPCVDNWLIVVICHSSPHYRRVSRKAPSRAFLRGTYGFAVRCRGTVVRTAGGTACVSAGVLTRKGKRPRWLGGVHFRSAERDQQQQHERCPLRRWR